MYVNPYGDEIENIPDSQKELLNDLRLPHFGALEYKDVFPILKFLNNKDKDIFLLVFVSQKNQCDVAKILGKTQSILSYDIQKIKDRISFILDLQSQIKQYGAWLDINRGQVPDYILQVLTSIIYTTSLTQASYIIGEKQIKVRYHFLKALKWLEYNKHQEMYELFSKISNRLNIVKRIYSLSKNTIIPI